MVSTIRFRSIKAIDVGWRRSYIALLHRRRRCSRSSPRTRGSRSSRCRTPTSLGGRGGLRHHSRLTARDSPATAPPAAVIVTAVPRPFSLSHGDRSAAQLDVAPRDRQAEAGAGRLRREIGLEHAVERLLVHAETGVLDPDRRRRRPRRREVRRRRPPAGHRVQRVLDDVRQGAGDERAIDEDRRQRRADLVLSICDAPFEPDAVRFDDVVDQLHGIGRRAARGRRRGEARELRRRSAGAGAPARESTSRSRRARAPAARRDRRARAAGAPPTAGSASAGS